MKIIFTGIGKNGESNLESLIKAKWEISKIILPAGHEIKKIQKLAKENKIRCKTINGKVALEREIIKAKSDLLVVASFPYLLSNKVIQSLTKGAINIHGSLLPDYRGYHPVHWAIINGDVSTGVTLHFINDNIDQGDIIAQKKIRIRITDNIHTLVDKISEEGAKLLIKNLPRIEKGKEKREKQIKKSSLKAPKRKPEDGKIIWKKNLSSDIFNLSRALQEPYPFPFTYTKRGEKIEVVSTYKSKKPGHVVGKINDHYIIETVDGIIALKFKDNKNVNVGDVLK